MLLGTLQVPRGGRSTSIKELGSTTKISPRDHHHHRELARSQSEWAHRPTPASPASTHARARKVSASSLKDGGGNANGAHTSNGSAEEFFIDVILQRHARKLLSQARLFDLGTFAAQLDFHMVAWLKRESTRAARLENPVAALRKVHADFAWPFPILLNSVVNDLRRKQSSSSSTGAQVPPPQEPLVSSTSHAAVDEKFRALRLDISNHQPQRPASLGLAAGAAVSDSGYLSHHNNGHDVKDELTGSYGGDPNILSEQTINAMLRPHSFRGKRITGLLRVTHGSTN